jgi:hypothetical protein
MIPAFFPKIVPVVAAGGAYAGPGDIIPTWYAWGGLRAFRASTIGANAIRITRDSDTGFADIHTIAGGGLDLSAIATFLASTAGEVTTVYDQSGNGRHFTRNYGNSPRLPPSILGGRPAMAFGAAASGGNKSLDIPNIGGDVPAGPFTRYVVAERTANFSSYQLAISDDTTGQLSTNGAANSWRLNQAAGQLTFTASDNVWHAVMAVADGGSTFAQVDTTLTTGSLVSDGFKLTAIGGAQIGHFASDGTFIWDGYMMEFGLIVANPGTTAAASVTANAKAFYGF